MQIILTPQGLKEHACSPPLPSNNLRKIPYLFMRLTFNIVKMDAEETGLHIHFAFLWKLVKFCIFLLKIKS